MKKQEILRKVHEVHEWIKWVDGEGPQDAQIALVGEAPGAEEDTYARPFIGRAGKLLDGILDKLGLSRDELYVTNVVKVRPPGNKLSRLSEYGLTVEDFIPLLVEELSSLPNLKLVMALGACSMEVLTGRSGISSLRGTPLSIIHPQLSHLACYATYHPAYLLRGAWTAIKDVMVDFRKALGELHHEAASRGSSPYVFLPKREDFLSVLSYLEAFSQANSFACDIETQFGSRISVVGLYSPDVLVEDEEEPRSVALVIPFKWGLRNYWTEPEEKQIWLALRNVMSSNAVKIFQNGVYDLAFLLPFVGLPAPPWFDTMLAHALIDPEAPHSLSYLHSIYTTTPHYGEDFKDWKTGEKTTESLEKNAKDIVVTHQVYEALAADLVNLGLHYIFCGHTMPEVRAMFIASRRGACIDHEERKRLLDIALRHAAALEEKINKAVGKPVNVGSPKQMAALLYEHFKFPIQRNGKSKKLTTGSKAINRILAYHAHKIEGATELLQDILALKELRKTISSYLQDSIFDEDGILRYEVVLSGAETGRMSTRKTPFNTGLNIQTIPGTPPKGLSPEEEASCSGWARRMVVPRPGYALMQADESQAEAVVVAYASGCAPLIKLFQQPDADVHSMIAEWATGIPTPSGQPHPQRKLYKKAVHGGNYGISDLAFSIELGVPIHVAKEVRSKYFSLFPEIPAWWESIKQTLTSNSRVLYTPLGRRRHFKKPWGPELWKEAYAYIPQSTVADIAHMAINKLWYIHLPEDCWIIQQSHDSVLLEHPVGMEDEVEAAVRKAFRKPILMGKSLMTIKIDVERLPRRWKE